jgi:aspartokinase
VLPDFVRVKRLMNRRLLRWLETQISATNTLIQGVSRFTQHEGIKSTLHRADDSKSDINFREAGAEFTQTRAEMRQFDVEAIKRKLLDVARSMGEQQTKRMLELVNEAATETGNVVNAGV